MSKKFKEHMQAHEKEFLNGYDDIIQECKALGVFDKLNKQFETLTVKLSQPVGYSELFTTTLEDKVIYARRKGRDTYTRFVLDREPYITDSCAIILNRNYDCKEEYYLITMFPGYISQKEPQDRNIKSRKELIESLNFWKNHALLFRPEDVIIETITDQCPYKHLYDLLDSASKVANNSANR